MDRSEHLVWCKERALELLDRGDPASAVASIISDLGKHDETKLGSLAVLMQVGMLYVIEGDAARIRRWIEGFH